MLSSAHHLLKHYTHIPESLREVQRENQSSVWDFLSKPQQLISFRCFLVNVCISKRLQISRGVSELYTREIRVPTCSRMFVLHLLVSDVCC